MPKRRPINILVFLLFVLYSREVYAYVDPGTGGYLFQVLFLAFSAVVAVLALFGSKVEAAISGILSFVRDLFRG